MVIFKDASNGVWDPMEEGFGVSWKRTELSTGGYNNNLLNIPGHDKIWDFGIQPQTLPFEVELLTNHMSLERMDEKLGTMHGFFYDAYGMRKTVRAYFAYNLHSDSPKFRIVYLREPPIVDYDTDFHKVKLIFDSIDRYKYGEEETTIETISGSTIVDISLPMKGVLSTYPTIEIDGTGTNVTVRTNGKTVGLGNLESTKSYLINAERYVVTVNEIASMIKVPKDFLIIPGEVLTFDGIDKDFTVRVTWHDRFL